MNSYGISYDHSTVIDKDGIIQYSGGGVSVSVIQNKIDALLSTSLEENPDLPFAFELYNNYPNPFNPETSIRFSVDTLQKINLNIYDVQGRLIRRLVEEYYQPGIYTIRWDGKNQSGKMVASGFYLYQLKGHQKNIVRKMQLLR